MNDDSESGVSDYTREAVLERDNQECWLCENKAPTVLQVCHQIDSAASDAFTQFQLNGTIPSSVNNSAHRDNLITLCSNCHLHYDAAFPDWIFFPDIPTIERYIQHEIQDYEARLLISKNPSRKIPARSLPTINRSTVLYYPAFLASYMPRHGSKWPKNWLGEPTTVIHRVARRGLLESTPVRSPLGNKGWQRGVPAIFQMLIEELIRLWARPPPNRERKPKV